jgi:hypothetical protein
MMCDVAFRTPESSGRGWNRALSPRAEAASSLLRPSELAQREQPRRQRRQAVLAGGQRGEELAIRQAPLRIDPVDRLGALGFGVLGVDGFVRRLVACVLHDWLAPAPAHAVGDAAKQDAGQPGAQARTLIEAGLRVGFKRAVRHGSPGTGVEHERQPRQLEVQSRPDGVWLRSGIGAAALQARPCREQPRDRFPARG